MTMMLKIVSGIADKTFDRISATSASFSFFVWYGSQIICDKGSCYQDLLLYLILLIMVYIVWSLIQNKK